MTRALVAVLVLALAATAGLLPSQGPFGSGEAGAAECSWQRHAKRVVKQVRRGGKWRRVVRKRHWWSCDAVAAVPAPSPAAIAFPPPADPAAPGEPEPEAGPSRVGVKALEYSFTLSRPSVEAGTVTIELNNQGEDPHNLQLEPVGGPGEDEEPHGIAETAPLSNRSASFELAAGQYRLWCDLESHDEWGMHATLVVADP